VLVSDTAANRIGATDPYRYARSFVRVDIEDLPKMGF
jgi:hypothetical protein